MPHAMHTVVWRRGGVMGMDLVKDVSEKGKFVFSLFQNISTWSTLTCTHLGHSALYQLCSLLPIHPAPGIWEDIALDRRVIQVLYGLCSYDVNMQCAGYSIACGVNRGCIQS